MAAYSLDLRTRIVDAVERGLATKREIARTFGVHETFVHKLLRQSAGDAQAFDLYVEHFLAPELLAGDVVRLDNVKHQSGLPHIRQERRFVTRQNTFEVAIGMASTLSASSPEFQLSD